MDANVIPSVRKEETELLRKLAAVQAMLIAYGEQPAGPPKAAIPTRLEGPSVPAPAPSRPLRDDPPAKAGKQIENFTPYGRQVIAFSMVVMDHLSPVKTRELVQSLELFGVEIRGENKINALGALLGRSADIVSHGKMGWTLADPDKAIEIVGKYARIENEPPSVSAGGSDAADASGQTLDPAQDQSNWGSDA